MKTRTFFSALAVAALAVLVIGIGTFWGITARSPLGLINQGGQALPMATRFVPKNAPLVLSLLVKPDRLTSLWQLLAAPSARRQTQAEINQLEKALLAGTGLTYKQDIQPWLGDEITFAITEADLDHDSGNGQQPGYLLALSCQDGDQARAVLELFWQKRVISGDNLVFEQFAGSKLIYSSPLKSPPVKAAASAEPLKPLASALVGNHLVLLANDPTILQQALTSAQATDVNLAQDRSYQQALAALPDHRIALAMVNLPTGLGWLGLSTASESSPALTGIGEADGVVDRAILSFRLHREGLLADSALLAARGHTLPPSMAIAEPPPVAMAKFLPVGLPLTAIGRDLSQLWQGTATNLAYYGQRITIVERFLDHLQAQLGEDELKTLLGWVKGDYALGLLEGADPLSPDWILIAEHSGQTQQSVEDLDELARQRGLAVGSLNLEGHSVLAWTRLSVKNQAASAQGKRPIISLSTEVLGLHADMGDFEILATSPTALYTALRNTETPPLDTPLWQQVTKPLDEPNQGYLILEWPTLRPLLLQQVPLLKLVEAISQPISSHVRSIAITSYRQTEHFHLGGIFLRLGNL